MTPTTKSSVPFELVELSKTAEYAAGETIVGQGEHCKEVHYIREGIVKLTMVSKRGRGAVLGILGQADFFGEQCITGQTSYLTSAVALVPTTIITIKRDRMLRLVQEKKSVSAQFLNYLLARNYRIQQDLIDHIFNSSEKRLARTLLLLAGYQNSKKDRSILEAIRQDNLAEMVGTTRQRVNFFMNKFRRLGLIEYNGGVKIYGSLRKVLEEE